jgi:hypothetical protein
MPGTPSSSPDLRQFAIDEARRQRVPEHLVLGMIETESAWDPLAISSAGAEGLMQLMPDTARAMGVRNPYDPQDNIRGGTKYMRKQLDIFGNNERAALQGYHGGPGIVAKLQKNPNAFPRTTAYPDKVFAAGGQPTSATAADFESWQTTAADFDAFTQQTAAPPPAPGAAAGAPPGPEVAPAHVAASSAGKAARIGPGAPGWVQGMRTVLPGAGGAIGGALGGTAGAGVGGPPGAFVGGLTGAGIGAGVGEAVSSGVEWAASKLGLTATPPPSAGQVATRVGQGSKAAVVGEGLGRGAGKVLSKVAAPLAGKLSPAGASAKRLFPNSVTPGQVSDSRAVQIAENVAEGSFFGGGKIAAKHRALETDIERKAYDIVGKFGGQRTSEAVGGLIRESTDAGLKAASQRGTAQYDKVFEAADAAKLSVSPTNLEAFVQKEPRARAVLYRLLDSVAPGWNKEADGAVMSDGTPIPDALKKVLQSMGELPEDAADGISLKAAHNLRSELLAQGRTLEKTTKDVPAGYTKKLASLIDQDLHAAAGDLSPQLRAADKFWKDEVKGTFQTKFLRTFSQRQPSTVANSLIANGRAPEDVREVMRAVDSQTRGEIQHHMLRGIVNKSRTQGHEGIEGDKLLKELSARRDHLREAFPGGEDQELWEFARAVERVQQKKEGTGGVAIKLWQSSAAGAAFTLSGGPGAAGILITPAIIGRLMTTSGGLKYLTEGIKLGKGATYTGKGATHLAAQLAKLGLTEDQYSTGTKRGEPPPRPQ